LLATEEGQSNAVTYLEERGYDLNTIEKFQLGYNPTQKNAFASVAIRQQFSQEILLKSGLVINRNDELIDNYGGRIIFPIHNTTERSSGLVHV
jgi:DNA primase